MPPRRGCSSTWCGTSARRGLGIVFVSHFLDQVFELTDRVTVLRNGRKIVTEETADLDRLRLIEHMLGHELEELAAKETRPRPPARRPAPNCCGSAGSAAAA